MITLESYKAKVYEVLTKLCALNGAISIKLNNERVKNHPFLASPENMAENDEAIICFTYDSDELYPEKICFCKKKIWLIYKSQSITKECENNLLKLGFESYKIFNFDNTVEYTKLIVSQEDFLDKDTQELALIFNSCILCHQYVHNEILRIPFKGIHALNNKIKPLLEKIAEKHSLVLNSEKIKDRSFYFKNAGNKLWFYSFWYDYDEEFPGFNCGIEFYNYDDNFKLTDKQDKLLERFLRINGGIETEEPLKKWDSKTFEILSEKPEQFVDYIENKLSEMEEVVKKAGLA